MPTKTWKSRERKIARMLGTERTPLSGRNSGQTASDTLSTRLFVEAKHRKRHAVLAVWDEAARHAAREGKLPVVALTQHGRPGCWWVIRSQDLDRLIEAIKERDEELSRLAAVRCYEPVKSGKGS